IASECCGPEGAAAGASSRTECCARMSRPARPPTTAPAPMTAPDDLAPPAANGASSPDVPRIWLVLSDKAGDNAHGRTVADALPWPCREKGILMRGEFVLGKPRVAASLHHVDPARSDKLEPPWPDLVITIGRRMSMVGLWIKQQSRDHTKLVIIGRPRRLLRRFELV